MCNSCAHIFAVLAVHHMLSRTSEELVKRAQQPLYTARALLSAVRGTREKVHSSSDRGVNRFIVARTWVARRESTRFEIYPVPFTIARKHGMSYCTEIAPDESFIASQF